MIINYKNLSLAILVLILSLYQFIFITEIDNNFLIFGVFIIYLTISLLSPQVGIILLLVSSVYFEKIGIEAEYYFQSGLALILFIVSLILYVNKYLISKQHFPYYKKIHFFLILILILLLLSKLNLNEILTNNFNITNFISSKLSDNTSYYYYVMIIRWFAILAISYLVLNSKDDFYYLLYGLILSIIPLFFSLNSEIFNSLILMCNNNGFDGFQTEYLNRADFSYKISFSFILIIFISYFYYKNAFISTFLICISTIFIFLSAGKGGFFSFLICLVIFLWNKIKLLLMVLITLFLIYTLSIMNNFCNVNTYFEQHFKNTIQSSVLIRLQFYNQSVKQLEVDIPKKNVNEKEFLNENNQNISSSSGTHNLLIDLINQFGLIIGSMIIIAMFAPIIFFLKILYMNNLFLFNIYLCTLIIFLFYSILSAALHIAILFPFFFSLSIVGIFIFKNEK